MTTNPKVRAGAPLQLHRAQPIDFVMSDDEEQEVRNGYDMAMKAPLPEREPVQTAKQRRLAEYHRGMRNAIPQTEPPEAVEPEEDGGPEMLAAVIVLTVVCVVLGFFIAGVLL